MSVVTVGEVKVPASVGRFAGSLAMVGVALGVAIADAPAGSWSAVNRAGLCITEGSIDAATGNRLSVDGPKMRAIVNKWTSPSVEVRFTYLGPTGHDAPLGSGEMRRQFALKLRAQDPCNLVYATWRFEPKSQVVVSVKRNAGESTSAECGNRGYRNVKPRRASAVPVLRPGDRHTFRAEMAGDQLRAFVDNAEVWEGPVGPDANGLDGPVGIRSDNARLDFELLAREYVGTPPSLAIACKPGAGE